MESKEIVEYLHKEVYDPIPLKKKDQTWEEHLNEVTVWKNKNMETLKTWLSGKEGKEMIKNMKISTTKEDEMDAYKKYLRMKGKVDPNLLPAR